MIVSNSCFLLHFIACELFCLEESLYSTKLFYSIENNDLEFMYDLLGLMWAELCSWNWNEGSISYKVKFEGSVELKYVLFPILTKALTFEPAELGSHCAAFKLPEGFQEDNKEADNN